MLFGFIVDTLVEIFLTIFGIVTLSFIVTILVILIGEKFKLW